MSSVYFEDLSAGLQAHLRFSRLGVCPTQSPKINNGVPSDSSLLKWQDIKKKLSVEVWDDEMNYEITNSAFLQPW